MWPEMKELVTKYSPHVLWVDGDWETEPPYWGSKDIRAWLYNEAPSRQQIVTNDRYENKATEVQHHHRELQATILLLLFLLLQYVHCI